MTSNIYIPISFDCSCCSILKNLNLRKESYPFDWNIITYEGIYNLIKNDFIDLFNPDYLVYGNKSYFHKYNNDENNFKYLIPVFNTKYNILFVHDFIENNDNDNDNNIIFEKYNRRIKRFINNLLNDKIILVYENTSNEYMNNIYKYWTEYFEKDIFFNLCNNFNNYNINDIKNLIEKKYINKNIVLQNIDEIK
jgi:hypothetical protein